LRQGLSSFHKILEKTLELLPLVVRPGPHHLYRALQYGDNRDMTQTFNLVDHDHLCSSDEFCKAVFEYCGIPACDNCNANNSSTFFAIRWSDRIYANDTASADFFIASSLLK
jgi:hypothetical protein